MIQSRFTKNKLICTECGNDDIFHYKSETKDETYICLSCNASFGIANGELIFE